MNSMNFDRRAHCFARLARTTSRAALGSAMLFAGQALAQESATQDAASGDDVTEEAIVVTGYRASLYSAVNEKLSSDLIVESISAEDIGKLPDASIAESLARLPGLTSQRLSGRSQVISIRGFAPDFSTTLLNGREQVTTGDNRSVEFDQYPSEVINQVLVYKTPNASLVGQGLSGTVDLRTIRPLAYGKQVISIGARGEYADLGKLNAGSDDLGFRVNGTYVDQFADDTIGISIAVSHIDSPYQIEEFNSWGYPNVDADNVVIGGSKSFVTSTTLKRTGIAGTLEFEPTNTFNTAIDVFYSDFKDSQIKRGVELPLFWSGAQLQPGFQTADGLVTQGQFNGVKGVVRNDANVKDAEIFSAGWNGTYEGENGWKALGDISYSKVDRSELVLETYSGTGRGGLGATDNIGFVMTSKGAVFSPTLDYSDPNLIFLTSPQGWGGDIDTNKDGTLELIGGQDGFSNKRTIDDELWQFRGEVSKAIDNGFLSAVKVGLNYTTRDKSLTPDEFFLGLKANTDGLTSVPIPQEALLRPTNLGFLGLGPVVSYDPVALFNSGIYNLVRNSNSDVLTKGWAVSEDVMTAYAQADIRTTIGASELTGNIGVQFIATDQSSTGFAARQIPDSERQPGDPVVQSEAITRGTDYNDWLPSINLSLRMPDNWVVRFGAAREISRPRLDDLASTANFSFNEALVGSGISPFSGRGGNPTLKPWRANAVDLSFEKYFGGKGYVALQLFYKDLKSYIFRGDLSFDFTGFPLPTGVDPADINFQGFVDQPLNGEGGELYGAELAGTIPFELISPALEGFGITGGGSYTKTKVRPSPNERPQDLPGYSKWVGNVTAFFEKWGFSARGSLRYRSTFVGELSGFGANRTRRRALGETIIDAQIGYEFQDGSPLEGLSLLVQGQNLTDERFATTNPGEPLQIIDYQVYGRRYLFGFNYKF